MSEPTPRAGQVPRDREYGNFRPDKYARQSPSRRAQAKKQRERDKFMSPEHLALIRQLPCACCEKIAGEAHHLKSGAAAKERGVGMKATDRWSTPLCSGPWGHHSALERIGSRREVEWFADFGINPHALAARALVRQRRPRTHEPGHPSPQA